MDSVTDVSSVDKNIRKGTKVSSTFWFPLWKTISLLAILHLVAFDFLILAVPEIIQVQYTPDDGYYYLALARNFIRFGEWTFDGGMSLTSGFHLMQAYLLAAVYRLFQPSPENFVRLGLSMSAVVTMIVVLLAWRLCLRKKDTLFLIVFTILITAKSFLLNSISITEWPLVILIAGLYCAYFYEERSERENLLIPFGLGLLGSLARSDFGLLPFSIFIATLFVALQMKRVSLIRAASAGLVGAVFGIGLIFVHNFITTNTFLQSSALMKSYWAQFGRQQFYSAATLGLQALGMDLSIADFKRSTFLLTVFAISGPVLLILLAKISGQNNLPPAIFKLDPNRPIHERVLVLAAALCLAGYTILYTLSGTMQSWYTANLIWPIFILLVGGARYLDKRILEEYQFILIWLSVFAVTSIGIQILSLYPLGEKTSPLPHQQFMLEAGRYLQQNPVDGYVGSWNAGITGYYQGGIGVINIDGLVNNDIYPYAVQNKLPAYLRAKNIHYIIDFENMFYQPFPKRGGYEDADFLAHLIPIKTFDQGEFIEFKFLRLYRIGP
ncbi:MAG TPA: hypothetical protein VK206_09720 [Anaerolineales bacterium]|nr:hypothetical protein [Anaerolineales bacterium]